MTGWEYYNKYIKPKYLDNPAWNDLPEWFKEVLRDLARKHK